MTMKDYYKMSFRECDTLCDNISKEGKQVGEIWNSETYRNNNLIEYCGDTFQIDSILGIVDINNSRKDMK